MFCEIDGCVLGRMQFGVLAQVLFWGAGDGEGFVRLTAGCYWA